MQNDPKQKLIEKFFVNLMKSEKKRKKEQFPRKYNFIKVYEK